MTKFCIATEKKSMKSVRLFPVLGWWNRINFFSISFPIPLALAFIAEREREQKQKRAGSQRNQLQFLLQVGTCGRILSEKFTNMFRRLIPVIQLIKQFIFIDSGINVFAMLRHALAAMATSAPGFRAFQQTGRFPQFLLWETVFL